MLLELHRTTRWLSISRVQRAARRVLQSDHETPEGLAMASPAMHGSSKYRVRVPAKSASYSGKTTPALRIAVSLVQLGTHAVIYTSSDICILVRFDLAQLHRWFVPPS